MKGRTPNKDEKEFMDKICQIGCIVCRNLGFDTPHVSPHHLDGRSKPGAHYKVIPLCGPHHQIPSPNHRWASRHGDGKAVFEKSYGKEIDLYHQCLELIQ